MNKSKTIAKSVFILSFITLIGLGPFDYSKKGNDDCVSFTVKSSKSVYLESEPVWLEYLAIINKKCVLDMTPFLSVIGDIRIILINSKGDTMKYGGGDGLFTKGGKNDRDTVFNADNLLLYYGRYEDFPQAASMMLHYLPAERYTAFVKLRYYVDDKELFVYGDTVNFEVKKAEGEEVDAKNHLIGIYKAFGEFQTAVLIKNLIDQFNSLYPNSVYNENVNYWMMLYAKDSKGYSIISYLLSKQEQINFLINRINRNADDNYNVSYIAHLMYLLDKDDFKNLLTYYKTSAKGTNLEKHINNNVLYKFREKLK